MQHRRGRGHLDIPVVLDMEALGVPSGLDAGFAQTLFSGAAEQEDRRKQEKQTWEHEAKLREKRHEGHLINWTWPWKTRTALHSP